MPYEPIDKKEKFNLELWVEYTWSRGKSQIPIASIEIAKLAAFCDIEETRLRREFLFYVPKIHYDDITATPVDLPSIRTAINSEPLDMGL